MALRSRQKKVVVVVASMAEAARLYVHVKRVSIEPEIEGGMTALSCHEAMRMPNGGRQWDSMAWYSMAVDGTRWHH